MGIIRTIAGLAVLLILTACGSDSDNDSGANSNAGNTANSACNQDSWIGGITELCSGHLVYRDYVYDDYGADLGLIAPPGVLLNLSTRSFSPTATQPAPLTPSAGDVTYPDGAGNTADLIRLELAIDGDQLKVEFELNTLFEPQQTIAALAIDTDNNPETGGGEWPGLGVGSTGWDVLETFSLGDPETNIISGSLPLPAGDTWRVQAVLAQADGTV
ncbi:MAG: hypothetical protein R3352_08565, partial [Salinisphaeraceae bacterium]|nr:hypothetical protein [Salinisphaeraceae bacterium]